MSATRLARFLLLAALLAPTIALAPTPALAQQREPLLIPGKKSLFQRVITRPGAVLSASPGAPTEPQAGAQTGPQAGQAIPGFAVFYVYARQGGETGWIEVGKTAAGRTEGWIPAAKAIDWKHTMIGAFTNPAGRQPVLFLNNEQAARQLILAPDAGDQARRMRAAAEATPPQQSPVIAVEPERFINIRDNFYLMPILSAQRLERETGAAPRLLEVITAPADQPRPQTPQTPQAPTSFRAGVVFLVDTTTSMQPYIEAIRTAMKTVVGRVATTTMRDNFRFGLVGYRDSLEDGAGLEYHARVFARPDFNQPLEAFLPAIAEVRESRVSSQGFAEDPIGGLKMTIDEVDWNGLTGGGFIILITDASARPATHPHSVTRMGITEIRTMAQTKGIAIYTLHLKTPAGARIRDHDIARAQYQELSAFNATNALYYPVENGAPDEFAAMVQTMTNDLLQHASHSAGRPGAVPDMSVPGNPRQNAAMQQMREQIRFVSEAMRLRYLGRVEQTRAPDVVRSWTTDRDLADPTISSLDIRVLLTRNQLSDLAQALQMILQAGIAGRTEPRNFFTQLRSAFAAAARDPQRISQSNRIGAMLGEYLEDLPYQSEIMDIGEDDWLQMGAIGQRTVLNNIESRLRLYQEFQEHPELWFDLSGSRSPGEAVYPVPIEALP